MSLRDGFIKALAENEDDLTTRLVFADWLDEQGEHEESERQRKWPAAKEWLVRFCQEISVYQRVTYEEALEFGRRAVREAGAAPKIYMENESLWRALQANSQDFFQNWAIVTGIPLPASMASRGFHRWQCCPNENYYWFGAPDETE